jgi:hypothetical protein
MPGATPKTSITFDDVFNEKRIETVFEGVYWYELVRLYYFNPAKAKAIINAQDKGSYTVTHVAGTEAPRQYTATYNSVTYPVSDQTMFLPLPEAEVIKAPNLLNPPVPFDFSKFPE